MVTLIKIKKLLKYVLGIAPFLFLVGVSLFLLNHSDPDYIVELVGVQNAYLLLFITAIFGGFTTFNIIPYHVLLVTLAVGGLNPFILGFLAATGVSIGDSTSYFVGYQGRMILPEKMGKWFDRINHLARENPKLFMLVCFLYSSIIPASNDFLTIPAGLARYPVWRVMIPLVLGNIVFDVTLAYFATHADSILHYIFV